VTRDVEPGAELTLLERDLLAALEGMVAQHCGAGPFLRALGLSANKDALEFLESIGRVRRVGQHWEWT